MAGQAGSSYLGQLSSWSTGLLNYASEQLSSIFSYEELDVVDPDADAAAKGAVGQGQHAGVHQEERKAAWGSSDFQRYIGMDVTSLLSVPVWIMEPVTVLQKAAEIMEYSQLLDKADMTEDPVERFALVVAFLVSPYGASERAWKPFNPVLGETFELQTEGGAHYLAEQVSHHPPVCAAHAESEHWQYDLVSAPTTRFLGNSLEVFPHGRTRIRLRRCGELFSHVPPQSKAHNIVIGRTWVDSFGDFTVTNTTTAASCTLHFTPCGWFSSGRYEFSGHIVDADGVPQLLLQGRWNSHCDACACDEGGVALPGTAARRLWTCAEKLEGDWYSFTHFAHALNGVGLLGGPPLPSDSRRRPDRAALAAGDVSNAGAAKTAVEERQRAERRQREATGDAWAPRWFEAVADADADVLPNEPGLDKVPAWRWKGHQPWAAAEAAGQGPAVSADDVCGVGFKPWQYAELGDAGAAPAELAEA